MFPFARHAQPSFVSLKCVVKEIGRSNVAPLSGRLASTRSASTASPAAAAKDGTTTTQINTNENGAELFTAEHRALRDTLARVIDKDINPYVDEWEASGRFPAHQVFKKLGDAGLLGLTKPVEFGGMGLDYRCGLLGRI